VSSPADGRVGGHLARALDLGGVLRERYADGTVHGTFVIELATQGAVRALALAGFDFVVIDLEHSPLDLGALPALIAEAHAVGIPALVRPWSAEPGLLGKILDTGANGLLIPHVVGPEQARAVVEATRYAPGGSRGVCPLVGPTAADAYAPGIRDGVLVVLQIEGREGVRRAAEIAATPGIDGVFVGPYDLSHALGEPGEVNGAVIVAAAADVAGATPPDVMLGMYVDDPADSAAWSERGYRLQCVSFDGRMLLERARGVVAESHADISEDGRVR